MERVLFGLTLTPLQHWDHGGEQQIIVKTYRLLQLLQFSHHPDRDDTV